MLWGALAIIVRFVERGSDCWEGKARIGVGRC
jgi:hypothetical protein